MSDAVNALDRLVLAELASLLDESLKKIRHCLAQLSDEQVWQRPAPQMNSIGNLLLHISGNLRQWAINGIHQRDDDRDRESEFSADGGVSKQQLLQLVEAAVSQTTDTLSTIDASTLREPLTIQGFHTSALTALLHTVTHFSGHTHQIIQLSRLHLGDAYQFQRTPNSPRDTIPL
jgi:uncharacterized damage-inducible protein DinB